MTTYVDIVDTAQDGDKYQRHSTLMLSHNAPRQISVLGNLPHAYDFRPTTPADRDRLVSFLLDISYKE